MYKAWDVPGASEKGPEFQAIVDYTDTQSDNIKRDYPELF